MNIRETAEHVARSHGTGGWQTLEDMIIYAEALVAELAKENKPVYAFRRKGLDDFCTCDERRYNELAQKPTLFEIKVLYTIPPTAEQIEQIEQETVEACAKVCKALADCDENTEPYRQGASWCEEAIRSGAWKEYK